MLGSIPPRAFKVPSLKNHSLFLRIHPQKNNSIYNPSTPQPSPKFLNSYYSPNTPLTVPVNSQHFYSRLNSYHPHPITPLFPGPPKLSTSNSPSVSAAISSFFTLNTNLQCRSLHTTNSSFKRLYLFASINSPFKYHQSRYFTNPSINRLHSRYFTNSSSKYFNSKHKSRDWKYERKIDSFNFTFKWEIAFIMSYLIYNQSANKINCDSAPFHQINHFNPSLVEPFNYSSDFPQNSSFSQTRLDILVKKSKNSKNSGTEPQVLDLAAVGIASLNKIQTSKKLKFASIFGIVLKYILPETKIILGVVATAIGAALANLMIPLITGQLINAISSSLSDDLVFDPSNSDLFINLIKPASNLMIAFFSSGVFTFAHIYFVTIFGENVSNKLKNEIFSNILSQNMAFFESSYSKHDLINRLAADMAEFKSVLKQIVTQGLKSTTLAIGAAVQLVKISPHLSTSIAIAVPIMYFGLWMYGSLLRKLRASVKRWELIELGIITESIENIKTVKSFSNEHYECELYELATSKTSAESIKFGLHLGIFQMLSNFAIGNIVLVVLCYGGHLVSTGLISSGDLVAYLMSVQNAQRALDSLGVLLGHSIKAAACANRVIHLIPPNNEPQSMHSQTGLYTASSNTASNQPKHIGSSSYIYSAATHRERTPKC
ncbi:ATP-binding cassette sub-family B member 8, mitochondrial [Smittium culicis]|uniref:ATP-binding cassette sub-family B member 8, mitochondrial n=1 Tax=Smittium culicis TaxID=133412 RepID=A0A1R1YQ50_9FUNG|nr:ATP-binding cassette sub-family B member 8, mitochondrial [Smittium culicis]